MWTINYKGFYIHGYFDKPQCRVSLPNVSMNYEWKSLRAAKCAISRWTNKGVAK